MEIKNKRVKTAQKLEKPNQDQWLMRYIRNYFTVSLHINQEMYPLNKSIIFDSGFNINIVNQKSLLRYYKNATPGKYI